MRARAHRLMGRMVLGLYWPFFKRSKWIRAEWMVVPPVGGSFEDAAKVAIATNAGAMIVQKSRYHVITPLKVKRFWFWTEIFGQFLLLIFTHGVNVTNCL